ncbi:hypothetical protein AMTR_s00015p00086390, partial [Amborella trichopoda]
SWMGTPWLANNSFQACGHIVLSRANSIVCYGTQIVPTVNGIVWYGTQIVPTVKEVDIFIGPRLVRVVIEEKSGELIPWGVARMLG